MVASGKILARITQHPTDQKQKARAGGRSATASLLA
jgi:hypothetical protein